MGEGMDSDSSLIERLKEIEARLRRLESAVRRRSVAVLDRTRLDSAGEAAERFLELSEEAEGRWKGDLSAVEEVRRMREAG